MSDTSAHHEMKTVSPPKHSTWQDLLQIGGAFAIVAFHTRAPLSQTGWAAVELFFVMAGMRMGGAHWRQLNATSL